MDAKHRTRLEEEARQTARALAVEALDAKEAADEEAVDEVLVRRVLAEIKAAGLPAPNGGCTASSAQRGVVLVVWHRHPCAPPPSAQNSPATMRAYAWRGPGSVDWVAIREQILSMFPPANAPSAAR